MVVAAANAEVLSVVSVVTTHECQSLSLALTFLLLLDARKVGKQRTISEGVYMSGRWTAVNADGKSERKIGRDARQTCSRTGTHCAKA